MGLPPLQQERAFKTLLPKLVPRRIHLAFHGCAARPRVFGTYRTDSGLRRWYQDGNTTNKIAGGRPMIMRILRFCSLGLLFAFWLPMLASAQALPPLSVCNT